MNEVDFARAQPIDLSVLDWIWVLNFIMKCLAFCFGIGAALNLLVALIVSAMWIARLAEWGTIGRALS